MWSCFSFAHVPRDNYGCQSQNVTFFLPRSFISPSMANHVFLQLIFVFVVFQDSTAPDMSFIFDWIYSSFSSALQFLGKCC